MFNKKNDPLVESVKAVMKQNEVHRQAEAALNEELGISSKKALPHEYHAQYDALLEAKVVDAEKAAVAKEKLMRPIRALTSKIPSKKSKDEPEDHFKEKVKRELPEETEYSPKQKKLAKLGTVSGHGGNPKKIDEPDLSAARKGHAHKVGLEEKKLTPSETSEKERLVKKMKKGDWSERYGKRGKEVMYATATKMAKKLAEAEGDVDPSTMTPISKGLQDRIVKDPPQPKPEPKKMDEAMSAKQIAINATKKAVGTSKIPRYRISGDEKKEPNKASIGVMKSFVRRQGNMAESIIDEIRENLEANLIAIHESGDDELFENYVNSLTEEELDILGLNEQEPGFIGRALSKVGIKTPQVRQQETDRAAIGSMAGPSQKQVETNPTAPTEEPGAQTSPAKPIAVSSVATPPASTTPSTALAKPASVTTAPRPTAPAPRPAPTAQPRKQAPAMGSHTPFGAYGGSAGPLSLEESVKPQVKQSLESFVRNRFLKG